MPNRFVGSKPWPQGPRFPPPKYVGEMQITTLLRGHEEKIPEILLASPSPMALLSSAANVTPKLVFRNLLYSRHYIIAMKTVLILYHMLYHTVALGVANLM